MNRLTPPNMPSAAIGADFVGCRLTDLRCDNEKEKVQQAIPQPAAGGPPLGAIDKWSLTMKMTDRKFEIRYQGMEHCIRVPEQLTDEYVEDIYNRFVKAITYHEVRLFDIDEIEFVYCLVGNIVDKHSAGVNLGIRRGTKQFAPNTKVYCFPNYISDGYKKVIVLGKPRKKRGLIKVVIKSKFIKNWRLAKVYEPQVISEMIENWGWSDKEEDKNIIEEMVKWLPGTTVPEIPLTEEEK